MCIRDSLPHDPPDPLRRGPRTPGLSSPSLNHQPPPKHPWFSESLPASRLPPPLRSSPGHSDRYNAVFFHFIRGHQHLHVVAGERHAPSSRRLLLQSEGTQLPVQEGTLNVCLFSLERARSRPLRQRITLGSTLDGMEAARVPGRSL